MSAIAGGLLTRGAGAGAPVRRMLETMARRAPDGRSVWAEGEVALGHGLLATLPDPRGQPLADDGLVIVADLRLDNREALIAALSPGATEPSDAELALAAYRRWGEACPEKLLGDFAFAVWDAPRRTLFCARDHVGVKPFHYHWGPAGFLFATELRGVLAGPGVSAAVDEARIAEFMGGLPPAAGVTLHPAVMRLPPAHSLTATEAGISVRRYWRLEPAPPPPGDPAAAFRTLFTDAVGQRLRSLRPVACCLSGGLDSSSIAVVASELRRQAGGAPMTTLSLVFDETPVWNERPFIEAVLAKGRFDPVFIASDGYAPFGDFQTVLGEQEGPFLAPSLAMSRRLHIEASRRGIGVVLDGHGGDEVISFGYGRLLELARAGRWLTLWRQMGAMTTFGGSRLRGFLAYFNAFGPGRKVVGLRRRIGRLLGRRPAPAAPAERPPWSRFVDPELAARTGLAARQEAFAAAGPERARTEQAQHLATLTSDLNAYAFEVLDRLTAAQGIEGRYPMWDKRVAEFCLSLPAEQKLDRGFTRMILRRGLDGLLPPEVQWRRTKLDFGPHIIRGMLMHHRALLNGLILDDDAGLARYVDLPAVQEAYGRVVKQAEAANGYDVQGVWRTVVLGLWLRDSLPETSQGTA